MPENPLVKDFTDARTRARVKGLRPETPFSHLAAPCVHLRSSTANILANGDFQGKLHSPYRSSGSIKLHHYYLYALYVILVETC
jgi:hypothetical protein